MIKHQPRPGEIPLKAWVLTEALRDGVGTTAIHNRLNRGDYKGIVRRRYVNSKIVFIKILQPKT